MNTKTTLSPYKLSYWFASMLILSFLGCDDKPKAQDSYELSFILPEEDSTLGCGDDLNRATPDIIDIAVSLSASVPENEQDQLVIELSSTPPAFVPQKRSLTEGGRVIFDDLALPAGDYELSAKLLNGEVERASSTLNFAVAVDTSSPLCGTVTSSLAFVSPVEGSVISATDDLDNDLTNGVQIAVEVEVQGTLVSIGEQVEVQVNGTNPVRAQVDNGIARFESVTLPLSGTQELRALATGPNGLLESIISVEVNASACQLELSPVPMDGCDIGATADVDPERVGLQAELTATSDCDQVIWTVNGQTYPPVEVVDGSASLIVTLNGGENTFSARAQSNNGLGAEVATQVLDVDLTDPELNIDNFDEVGVNRRNREDALDSFNDEGEPILKWRFNGFTSDLPAGSNVSLTFSPEIPDAPSEIMIDDQGRFGIELTGEYICGYQVTLSGNDLCGGVHSSPSYSFCFDGVTPRLSIVEPANLTLVNTDEDPETEGLQSTFLVRVEDARDTEDYPIEIQCTRGVGGSPEILSVNSILRSELAEVEGEPGVYQGALVVSFPRADRYACQPLAMTGQNEPILATSVFRVITDEPIFEILDPTLVPTGNGRDYACFSDQLFIGGQGSQFSEDDTVLNFTLFNESTQQVARFDQLEDQGNGFYSTSVAQLPDGLYRLEISGTSGTVEVSVIPSEPIQILIDNEVPIVGPLSPAEGILTSANDANNDLADCIQSTVSFSLSDESAESVCFSLNEGVPTCTTVIDQGVVRTPVFNFLPGENNINMQVIDCTGASSEFTFPIVTQDCQPTLRITNWSDRAGVSRRNDIDAETEGLQISLSLTGQANETVSLEVNSTVSNSVSYGPITLDELGLGETIITLPTQLDTPVDVTITPTSMDRGGQSLNLTTYDLIPQLSIRPIDTAGDCLNASIKDRSSVAGFQLRMTVDADGMSPSSLPEALVYCSEFGSTERELIDQKFGVAVNLGQSSLITFSALTLTDGECDLEVRAVDVSGFPMQQQSTLTVDRTPPQVSLLVPQTDEPLNLLGDIDNESPGIQFPVRFSVCGAAGQTMTITTDPAQSNGPQELVVEEGDCSSAELDELTFVNGNQLIIANVADACGNEQLFEQNIEGNTGVTVVISEPSNQERIGVTQDLDLENDGCQINVSVISTGFTDLENVEFAVCASNQDGPLSSLCGNQTDASQGNCSTNDAQGNNITCPVSLDDGEHEISIVARENGVDLRSNAISVRTDCTAPSIVDIQVAEDSNADHCVNAQERANANAASSNATFTLNFQVDGIETDRTVSVRYLPGQQSLGTAVITEGQGILENVSLPQGEYFIYLSGLDEVGNTLPTIDSDVFFSLPLTIDTTAPNPSLIQPVANQCINIADDLSPAQNGAQYQPIVNSGSIDGEEVSLTLITDGIIAERESTASESYTFSTILLTEGNHELAVVSADSCGNSGSVAGFNLIEGRPNWSDPISIPISVDLTTPTLSLNGVTDGQILTAADDANQSPADGFQINVTVDTTGLEAGQDIQIFSGESRLPTLPARLTTTVADSQTLSTTLTLPPGIHALNVRAVDACDNSSRSATSEITIDIEGCSSQITSLESGQLFGPAQGTVTANGQLRLNVSGQVDLLDPACANAQAELLLDDGVIGSTTINATTGLISFTEVSIPEGEHVISTRVRLNNEETYSLGKTIRVDLVAPSNIQLTSPAPNAQGIREVLQDADTEVAGQQINLVALITETPITSARTARLSINGVQLPQVIDVPTPVQGSDVVEIRIDGINPPPSEATYQLCISDEASNEYCQSFDIIADPEAPSGFNLTVDIQNNRIPTVNVEFTAPGDDQSGGDQVASYEVRWSLSEINNELAWTVATVLPDLIPSALPGARENFSIPDLPPNQSFYLAIRARDDVGRLSPLRSTLVNTRINTVSVDFNPSMGTWDGESPSNTTGNPIKSIKDFNGDGYDDLLAHFAQPSFIGDAFVILGNQNMDVLNNNTLRLTLPEEMTAFFFGIEANYIGDVNGDGAPDLMIGGYRADLNGSAFAIYLGCPAIQNCDVLELASADSVISTPGQLLTYMSTAGDMVSQLGLGFDDIVLGGGFDNIAIRLIEGRETWPATMEADAVDYDLGIYNLVAPLPGSDPNASPDTTPEQFYGNIGVHSSTAGDTNNDGATELIFSAGGSIDHLFMVYGGSSLETKLAMNNGIISSKNNANFIEIENPCSQLGESTFGTMLRGGVDLSGDGISDFVVGNSSDKLLILMKNDLTPLDCFRRGEDQFGYRFDLAGDIDGNGFMDLIVANNDNNVIARENVYIFYNDGSGNFGENDLEIGRLPSLTASRPTGSKIGTSGAGDMNGDDKDDFAVLSYEGDVLKITVYY